MPDIKRSEKIKKRSKPGVQWNFQNLIFIAVVIIFAVSVIWSEPISHLFSGINLQDVNLTPSPTTLPGTPTPLPVEYFSNAEQTNGVLLGVIVLGGIIIAGTLGILIRDRS
jgi:hypothetical protein